VPDIGKIYKILININIFKKKLEWGSGGESRVGENSPHEWGKALNVW